MAEKITISTERLLLRPFVPEDGDAVWPVVSDPRLYATTLGLPREYPRELVDAWFARVEQSREEGTGYFFGVFRLEDGAYAGNTGLLGVDQKSKCASISFLTNPAFWGMGYATEAARALCRFGFETAGLHRIGGSCMAHNPASRAVMKKVGFLDEGTRRQSLYKDGVWYDEDMLGLLRKDFALD